MAATRKYTLKQMLTGEQEAKNIIPQLVAMGGGGGGFAGTTLPGAPINPPEQNGQANMSGWAELLKKLMAQGTDGSQGTQPGEYGYDPAEHGPWRY